MNELMKNYLTKAKKLCNIFRFIDHLNLIDNGGEFGSNYCNVSIELGKENTDKHESSFMDLDIKIKDEKFQPGHFDNRDSFLFFVVRMPDNSQVFYLGASPLGNVYC